MTTSPTSNSPGGASEERAGLRGVGEPLGGVDARPADPTARRPAPSADEDVQGGLNEQGDELRAHAAAQGAGRELDGGLDDTRASGNEGSINDNGNL